VDGFEEVVVTWIDVTETVTPLTPPSRNFSSQKIKHGCINYKYTFLDQEDTYKAFVSATVRLINNLNMENDTKTRT
jgi:hypothetical protein